MLPDGSKSSLWDQQVPAAFAAYQQPTAYVVAPGPTRNVRHSGPKAKPHTGERSHVAKPQTAPYLHKRYNLILYPL